MGFLVVSDVALFRGAKFVQKHTPFTILKLDLSMPVIMRLSQGERIAFLTPPKKD
jgi:hypothetical protein